MKKILYFLFAITLVIDLMSGRRTDAQGVNPTPVDPDAQRLKGCLTPGRPQPDVEGRTNLNALLCGRAISLPKPAYPEEAKAKKIAGLVRIKIVINEEGRTIWANAIEGDPLLVEPSIKAACQSRHSPMKISDRFVKATGIITYDFVSK
ncbi:MAG TPA: energy transducer TonB [Pyrinomonadaceae bacterium]|nr:energy transducer TonB [Pyrinomonadaceae bacterium]